VGNVLRHYLKERSSPAETFLEFSSRHDIDGLRRMPAGGDAR